MLPASSLRIIDPADLRCRRSEDPRHLRPTRPQTLQPETIGLSSSRESSDTANRRIFDISGNELSTPQVRRPLAPPIRNLRHLKPEGRWHLQSETFDTSNPKILGTSSLKPSTPQIRRPLAPRARNSQHLRSEDPQRLQPRTANVSDPKVLDVTEPSLGPLIPWTRRPSTSEVLDLRHRRPEGLWRRFSTPRVPGRFASPQNKTLKTADPKTLGLDRLELHRHCTPENRWVSNPEGLVTPSPPRGRWSLQPGGPSTPKIRRPSML
jgi:hypothetical protein